MITFANVTKQFGETQAVSDISFEVEKGELVLITGPSGSGKTTLMRLLIKEYEPTQGEITFDDQPLSQIRGTKVAHHRRRIGVVFQDYKLLPELNVWENIALPLSIIGKGQAETESRVTDLLKLIGLTNKAYLFPSQLSGGEAQRVSIARALATGPGVIFADEPTGNLDPETSLSIAKLLKQINRLGTTLLLATHDATVTAIMHDVRRITLRKGVLEHDTHPKSEVAEVALSGVKKTSSGAHAPIPTTTASTVQPGLTRTQTPKETATAEVAASVEDLDEETVEVSVKAAKKAKPNQAHKPTAKSHHLPKSIKHEESA